MAGSDNQCVCDRIRHSGSVWDVQVRGAHGCLIFEPTEDSLRFHFLGAGEVWRGCLNQPEALFSSAEGARPSGRRCVAPRPRWGALEAALSQGWRGRLGVDSARELRSRCPALTCPAHSPTHAPRASLPVQP